MRDAVNRDMYFLDFVITTSEPNAPKQSMEFLTNEILKLYKAKDTDKWSRDNKKKIWTLDMKIENNKAFMLICYGNCQYPEIPIMNLTTNTHRNAKQASQEAKPTSAHLIIEQTPYGDNSFRCRALLEEASDINRFKLQSYLNDLLRRVAKKNPTKFEFVKPDGKIDKKGNPKKYQYYNSFDIQGYLSKDFYETLERGKINNIELITEDVNIAYGEGAIVRANREIIQVKPVSGNWYSNLKANVKSALSTAKINDCDMVKVSFNGADRVSHTVKLDPNTENVLGDGFIKKERIVSETLLSEADKNLNDVILDKMLALL